MTKSLKRCFVIFSYFDKILTIFRNFYKFAQTPSEILFKQNAIKNFSSLVLIKEIKYDHFLLLTILDLSLEKITFIFDHKFDEFS